MFFLKIISILIGVSVLNLVFAEGAWAWGPAAHTIISCKILEEAAQIAPAFAKILRTFPLEYLYGSRSADFFVGNG